MKPAPRPRTLSPVELGTKPSAPRILVGDNLVWLKRMPDDCVRLIYIDPPFNTGKPQTRTKLTTVRDINGDRTGFGGHRYRSVETSRRGYADAFDDYLGWLAPRLREARRVLTADGSLFVHVDYREVHYVKILLDEIFGRVSFQNEIIWAYDYGARSKKRWSTKHDNILWYSKHPTKYVFRHDDMERIPYMAPGLVTPAKAARGKTPTDVWWHTIVSPTGREKTGYPTQKPLGILRRIVAVHSDPGDHLLDFFAGSGAFGEAAVAAQRCTTLIDENPQAIEVMRARLGHWGASVFTDYSADDQ